MPKEILFLVEESPEGGYVALARRAKHQVAQAPGFSIYTQAETLVAFPSGKHRKELKEMAVDAVRCHFDEGEMPRLIRLHLGEG